MIKVYYPFSQKIQEVAPGTPTLVITGYGNKEMVVELMRIGCLDYLDKSFAPPHLLEHIRYVFEKSRAQRERDEKEIRLLKRKTLGYECQLAFYRNTLEQFEMQLIFARGTYENFIQVDKDSFPLPIVWRMKQFSELGGDYFDFKAASQFCDEILAFCRHKPSDDMLLLGFEIPGSDVQGETYV